ncbi:MAG TPA: hypothetical protein VIM85_04960 [Pseudomonadales bacterium]
MYRAHTTNKKLLLIFLLAASIQFIAGAAHVLAKELEIPPPPKIQLMPGAQSSWIAPRMLQNGIPMSILQFSYPSSVASIESYYKEYRANKAINIEHLGSKTVIAYEENGYFYSIHISNTDDNGHLGTNGQIVATKLTQAISPARTALPVMPGSHIISKTNALDGNTDSETLMLSNHHSMQANYRYMDQNLKQQGWIKSVEASAADAAASQQLVYDKNTQSLQVTLFPLQKITDGHTGILIHWVK